MSEWRSLKKDQAQNSKNLETLNSRLEKIEAQQWEDNNELKNKISKMRLLVL